MMQAELFRVDLLPCKDPHHPKLPVFELFLVALPEIVIDFVGCQEVILLEWILVMEEVFVE